MPRKEKIPRNDLGIPEYEMESLARILLPIMREYLASEEGNETMQNGRLVKNRVLRAPRKEEATKKTSLMK